MSIGAAQPPLVEVSEEQALYFRARRGHLAGPGATDAAAAARAIVGAQAQQLPSGLLALSQRTAGRPTAVELQRQLFDAPRLLVRTWGQRDTLHLYDPTQDWVVVVAARDQWSPGRGHASMPTEDAIERARAFVADAGAPVTRKDLLPLVPAALAEVMAARVGADQAERAAAGRLLWVLVNRGHACVAGKVGAEQAYATRAAWFPDLPWPPGRAPAEMAAIRLVRCYLAAYGPATAADAAHFFGAPVGTAKEWMAALELDGAVAPVDCGGRRGLVALTDDLGALNAPVPAGARDWPLRLLPLFDSMLMGHADKSWTVPHEPDRKAVWRKAAFVSAAVLVRGRVVATWSHAVKRKRLQVTVTPLHGWRKAYLAGVRREARDVARHLGADGAEVALAR